MFDLLLLNLDLSSKVINLFNIILFIVCKLEYFA